MTVTWSVALLLLMGSCQASGADVERSISDYRDRMLSEGQPALRDADRPVQGRLALRAEPMALPPEDRGDLPARAALLARPAATTQPAPKDVLFELPDPSDAVSNFRQRLAWLREKAAGSQDDRVVRNYERVVSKAEEFIHLRKRPRETRLSLAECVQRAIENNYTVRIQAHNPAIAQTQIVEAEAAFDVEFFLDWTWANLDQATQSQFQAGYSDNRRFSGGFRQLLPSGMQASVGVDHARNKTGFPSNIQPLNPVYGTSFFTELRQPLARGFGLDVNRAQIELRKSDYRISVDEFIARVRDTLLEVETAYWSLVNARRSVAIRAEATAQNFVTWQNMIERLDHDATQVEVANAESRYQTAFVGFLESLKIVADAEDRLKNLINDPELKLSEDLEIIPTETPFAAATVLDQFAEVRTALDQRAEIRQAKERITQARIGTNVAKNQILPRFDLIFRYEVQGQGSSADNSWDNLTQHNFISYTIGASFSYNFGERRGRAQWTRARLQESQAVVALNQVTDAIVEEVNVAVRTLIVRYAQLPPALIAVNASERNLRSLQARTQRIDPNYLQTELGAVEQLAQARLTLLRVVTDYNIGMLQLEKAKGTLLDYNNISVVDAKSLR